MSYLAKTLAPGETIVARGRFSVMQHVYAWAILVLAGIVLVGIAIWAREMIRLSTTEFVVTNRRVVLKQGFLTAHVDEITLNSVEGAHIDQSLFGRIFNYGRLTVRGSGDTHLLFPTMDNPSSFRSAAESARMSAERLAPTQPTPQR
jgi:uncharacterized membrane protein YdbT with pleckstrin-like domain